MIWKDFKTWQKGLIIGLVPLVLVIILNLILVITPPTAFGRMIFSALSPFLYLASFVFLIFGVLIGFVLHKSWKTKVLAFLIVILVFSVITAYGFSGKPSTDKITTYKGIWSPSFLLTSKMLLLDIGQLKEDGVNTLSFGPNYDTDEDGNIHLAGSPEWLTILFIQTAHRKGFRVFLVPNMWGPNFAGVRNKTLFFEQATAISLEWADIAKKYGVEMYAPTNEPQVMIKDKEAIDQWAYKIAPKIKERYHGILMYKASIAEWGFDNDYRGYDYVGLDIFPHTGQTLEQFRSTFQNNIEDGLKFAERDGAKGVILSEIGVQVGSLEGPISTTEEPFSTDYQKEAYKIFFEEGDNKVIGYIFCCWDGTVMGPNNFPAEQVMKERFNKIE